LLRIVVWDVLPCKMMVNNHFTRQYIPEDNSEHHTRHRENLKSHMDTFCLLPILFTAKKSFYTKDLFGLTGENKTNVLLLPHHVHRTGPSASFFTDQKFCDHCTKLYSRRSPGDGEYKIGFINLTHFRIHLLSGQKKDFSCSPCVQTGSEAQPASCTIVPRVHSPAVKNGRGVTLTTHTI
jgi:hypothetical protein